MTGHIRPGDRWLRLSAWLRNHRLARALYRPLPRAWREKASSAMAGGVVGALRFPRTAAWADPGVPTTAGAALPIPPADGNGINLFGHLSGEFGLAEVARAYARALLVSGIPVALVDVGQAGNGADPMLAPFHDDSAPHAVNLLCTNPDDFDPTGEPVVEDNITPKDARTAAWQSFVQALFGSAEFRYLR